MENCINTKTLSKENIKNEENKIKTLEINIKNEVNNIKNEVNNVKTLENNTKTLEINIKNKVNNIKNEVNNIKTLEINIKNEENNVKTVEKNSKNEVNNIKTLEINMENEENIIKNEVNNIKKEENNLKTVKRIDSCWQKIETEEFINLHETLFSGQVFNFHKTDVSEYTGSIYFFIVTFIQKENEVFYKILYSEIEDQSLILLYIKRFFTLQINYKEALINLKPTGLRLINNSLIPTIFSFICSANNNVKRISKMVNYLYSKGKFACSYKKHDFHLFPHLSLLLNPDDFKNNGFGYRAAYISKTAEMILKNDNFLQILRYDEQPDKFNKSKIMAELIKLSGVGPKVRDCISLMGLGIFTIVPIDTHIFKHAKKLFYLKETKLTMKNYKEIQEKFVLEWGEYAGIYQLFVFKEYLEKR